MLQFLIFLANEKVLDRLLKHVVDLNKTDSEGNLPLHLAAMNSKYFDVENGKKSNFTKLKQNIKSNR